MADIITNSDSANNNTPTTPTSVGCVPQSGAAYARLVAVAPSAPEGERIKTREEPGRILRLPEVISRVGLRRASIYQHMNRGSFPRTISLGARAVGWLEREIDAWVQIRIQGRR